MRFLHSVDVKGRILTATEMDDCFADAGDMSPIAHKYYLRDPTRERSQSLCCCSKFSSAVVM